MDFMIQKYLEQKARFPTLIGRYPESGLKLCVVIPAHDEPNILPTLQSVDECIQPEGAFEVIVVANRSINADAALIERHQQMIRQIRSYHNIAGYPLHLIELSFEEHEAGVGLARKAGMDEALRRLNSVNSEEGLIVCLDADCTVNREYLHSIEKHFRLSPGYLAASISFKHLLKGNGIQNDQAILDYELYLRYYHHAVIFTGHPHSAYTIGSAMAVRAHAYAAQGGMNRRKAGEDFHFLLKFMEAGSVEQVAGAMVFPSARPSHRVPFGTGKAIGKFLQGTAISFDPFQAFCEIKTLVELIPELYQSDEALLKLTTYHRNFLYREGISEALAICRKSTSGQMAFRKRFFRWFNALRLLRTVHHLTSHLPAEVDPVEKLFDHLNLGRPADKLSALEALRKSDYEVNIASSLLI